jgi:predicted membrane channel-forming protein YqfA (hemolysin III family)
MVLNEFWATAPTRYKVLVFSAMGLIAVGIILNLIGNTGGNQGLAVASLPLIGLGLVLHVVGMVVRGQSIRKNLRR